MDASTLSPIANSQIYVNRSMKAVSSIDGSFTFYVNIQDTVYFNSLGYESAKLFISDTLRGQEFNTGIFMKTDTVEIGEVIIVPRIANLKSEILNAPSKTPEIMANARNNIAVSAYQGRVSQSQLGDPRDNYSYILQKQKVDTYEKGGIPSEHIAGINALSIIPVAYFLLRGLPEKTPPLNQKLTDYEVDQIYRKYLETLEKRKQP